MKKLGLSIALFCITICLASCVGDAKSDLVLGTTVAGVIENNVLDGNVQLSTVGTPFSEKEIRVRILAEMSYGVITSDYKISSNGYYHIMLKNNCLDYNNLTLPILKDGVLCGDLTIRRGTMGIAISSSALYGDEHPLPKLIAAFPEQNFAMVYAGQSEYAIADDNTVHVISGYTPIITNGQNLYSTFNLGDNIFSSALVRKAID